MGNYWSALRKFDRNIRIYMLYWAMISFAYFGVESVLMNLYLLRLGYGPEFIGLLWGAGQLVWAVFALPAGMVGSRYGPKQAMVAGMLVLAAGTVLMLAAEGLPRDLRAVGLFAGWMISWIGAALGAVNGAPYLMAVTNDQTRAFAFSAQQTVMAAAGFAGSMAAGVLPGIIASQTGFALDHPAPYRLALFLAPAAYLAGGLAFARAKPAPAAAQMSGAARGRQSPTGLFLLLGLVIALQAFSEGTVRAFYNIYLDTTLQMPTGQIGAIMGTSQLFLILVSLGMPLILARFGSGGSLTVMTFGLSFFIFLLAAVPVSGVAAGAYFGISAALAVMATARGLYSQEVVSPRWRTTASAVATVGLALGWALAAWLGGQMIPAIGYKGMFVVGAIFGLVSGGLFILKLRGAKAQAPELEEQAALEPVETT